MALTLTERFSYSAGGRKFVYVSVTHDETTTTFTGASVGLSYIEYMYDFGRYATTDTANTSVLLYSLSSTVPAGNLTADIGYPMKAGSKSHHLLIGW